MGTCRQCGSWSVAGHNHNKVTGRDPICASTEGRQQQKHNDDPTAVKSMRVLLIQWYSTANTGSHWWCRGGVKRNRQTDTRLLFYALHYGRIQHNKCSPTVTFLLPNVTVSDSRRTGERPGRSPAHSSTTLAFCNTRKHTRLILDTVSHHQGPNTENFKLFLRLPVRWDGRSETWFKTFCILITSQTLVSAKDKVTQWLSVVYQM